MELAVSLETFLRTALGVFLLPAAIVLGSTVALLLALCGAPVRRLDRIYVGCARLCLRVGGTRLVVDDLDRLDSERAYVVVPNHESMWDPVCMVVALKRLTLRFVAKREVMNLPVFGQALRLTGNVSVMRSRTAKDVGQIQKVMEKRDPGTSILFFAEGTRARDGGLHPFKMGAFATALRHRLPILPVGIAGTYAIWPKGRLRLRRAPVVVRLGDPIPTQGLDPEDREDLRDRTFRTVAKLRAEARARLRALGAAPGGVD